MSNFLNEIKTKFNKKQYTKLKSLSYMEGALLRKLTTRELLSMSFDKKDIPDENEDDTANKKTDTERDIEKIINILRTHIYDHRMELIFIDGEESFLQDLPIGDLNGLFAELMESSGAGDSKKVDNLKKK